MKFNFFFSFDFGHLWQLKGFVLTDGIYKSGESFDFSETSKVDFDTSFSC